MKLVIFSVLLLFLVAQPFEAFAKSDQSGAFIKKGTTFGGKFDYVAQLTVKEPLPGSGVFSIKGKVILINRSNKKEQYVLSLRGDKLGESGLAEGKLTYKDRDGKNVTSKFRESYVEAFDRHSIFFSLKKLGKTVLILDRRVSEKELEGNWTFSDGVVMSISKLRNGNYKGSYQGLASAGHGNLRGELVGELRENTWTGNYKIDELSVHIEGNFSFSYYGEVPPKLSGYLRTLKKTNYVLTKQ